MFQVKIFTLYPDFFPGILSKGIYGRAIEKSLWNLDVINIRDYAKDKHKTVDDTPYGGGEGMVLKPDVVAKALDQNLKKNEKIIYLTPKGKTFDQNKAKKFLEDGNKIKFSIMFRGREISRKETAIKMLEGVAESFSEISTIDKKASLEGRKMFLILSPK